MTLIKKMFCLGLIVLSNQFVSAQDPIVDAHHSSFSFHPKPSPKNCQLGDAKFFVTDPALWYSINVPAYPGTTTLSKNRNGGFKQGNVKLKSKGLKIGQFGNYQINFNAFLMNNDPDVTVIIAVARDGVFDPTDTSTIITAVTLPTGQLGVAQGSGILENVKSGTKLTLVATNAGGPSIQPITVIEWDINVSKIPCRPN